MICKAKKSDIKELNELGKLLYDNFEKTYLISNYLLEENYIILVDKEQTINGFLIVYKNIDFYELELIIVKEDCRNQKIGSKLIEFFIDKYCQKNDIILLEVSCKNEIALKLYKKYDFKIENIRKNYYKDSDAYIMKKVI